MLSSKKGLTLVFGGQISVLMLDSFRCLTYLFSCAADSIILHVISRAPNRSIHTYSKHSPKTSLKGSRSIMIPVF